ncbi:MAG: hypothetical protein GF398_14165 [Chitinivibrionales bacterium]|nr:hypothetical protein [Chitinivibrionales bacterium]
MKRVLVAVVAALWISSLLFPLHAEDIDTVFSNVMDFIQLQTALDLAESNMQPDNINIGGGTISLAGLDQYFQYDPPYRPDPGLEEHFPLIISGAGPGKTIIDGDGGSIFSILTGHMSDDFGADITVSGICFRNVTDPGATALGIGTEAASIRIYNCKFINCKGSQAAGVYASTGSGDVRGPIYMGECVVDSCQGAISLGAHNVVSVENCTFSNNTELPALSLSSTFGAHEIKNCTFTNNRTTTGAVVVSTIIGSGEITISKNMFSGNRGSAAGALRIGAVNSDIMIFRNEFRANHGTESGAMYCSNNGEGDMTLYRNVFTDNQADNYGGAANLFSGVDVSSGQKDGGSNIVVQSCLFARNKAAFGSSLHVRADKASADVLNCTFARDSVVIKGAGVLSMFLCNNSASATLVNNLFQGNVTKNGPLWSLVTKDVVVDNDHQDLWSVDTTDGTGAAVDFSHNVLHRDSVTVDSAASWSHTFDVDPLIDDSCRLTENSPAIDAGSPAAHAVADPGKDCSDNDRSIDGDKDGHAVVDIGAFEFDPAGVFTLRPPRSTTHNAAELPGTGDGYWYDCFGRRCTMSHGAQGPSSGVYIFHSSHKTHINHLIERRGR